MKVLLRTYGCQMNDYDSDLALGLLTKEGYETTDDESVADVILFNTCSVRQHAEDRVFNQIARLKGEKLRRPELMIGVMGCMVENYKTQFFKDYPQIDLLLGTRSIRELPKAIQRVKTERRKVMELSKTGFGYDLYETPRVEGKFHAYLPIMTGCDKVCSFCVVPYVRGPEISRSSSEVINTVRELAESGVKHITLLGQNVNSYGSKLKDEIQFPELLQKVAQVNGIVKIDFTTSHPQDAHEALFQVIRDEKKIARRFHLPLQSGSDEILKAMRRDHTLDEYKAKISRLRELVPDISLSTDIIVGFPGETDQQYEMTRQALEAIQYDRAFIFRYSPRPHTGAARFKDGTSEGLKTKRVTALLEMQKRIRERRYRALLGQTHRVLVAAVSKKHDDEVLSHNWQENKIVFKGTAADVGSVRTVKLNELVAETFRGVRCDL